ncbi:MAG: 2Fe-2S iron-sulfur cluster-binding protein [Gammaproteobacteria bacterium]|nr:2Fe-2S iron-sulfur cluster-binding protein [Gammaproteobacteria bacterium]
MPQVIFIHPDKSRETDAVQSGDTSRNCALDNHVDGIKAQCGGGANCSTCHCQVGSPWFEQLPECTEDENELLPLVWPRSRLACQVIMREQLNGILIHLPEKQI